MFLSARFQYIFVVFVTLVSIKLWSFKLIPDNVYDALEFAAVGGLAIVVITNLHRLKEREMFLFKGNVILFLTLPLISALAALVFHDQSLLLSVMILRTNFFWLLYFVLHIFEIDVKKIINLMVFIGIVWAGITIGEQFTYPRYYFYVRSDEDPYEFFRAGIYRFMIYQHQYCLFAVLYFYNQFLESKTFLNIFFVLLGLIGFYYYGFRQVAVAAIVCLILASISQKGSARALSVSVILIFAVALFYLKDILFKEYIEMTANQIEDSESDVRKYAAHFFLFEYWPHWITIFTGNGVENSKSSYGQEMLYLNRIQSMYRSDVGPIGIINTFGVFYLLNILWNNFKGLRGRYYTPYTQYYRLVFFNALIILMITDSYSVPSGAVPFFCFVFYLVEKSFEEKQNDEYEQTEVRSVATNNVLVH
jgi:hypothetical protein